MPRDGAAGAAGRKRRVGPERPPDFDKLPKRFRKFIAEMEQELSALLSMSDADDNSLVWLEEYGPKETAKRHLPSKARVCFKLPFGEVEVQIEERGRGAGLSISSSQGRIVVLPQVSNQILVKVGVNE